MDTSTKYNTERGAGVAVCGGCAAAVGGLVSKLAMDIHTRDPWLPSALHDSLCITVLLLGISVAVNGLGATLFASALDMSDSSLRVTALSFSSNFVLTGVVGWLLFHEGIGLKWVCGSALILAGVGILSKQQQHKPNKNP